MPSRNSVSAVIVTYESRPHIDACLNSLKTTAEDWLRECMVVDNASSDGTAEHIRQTHPWVRLSANSENIGFGAAVNQGARQATGDYILVLNPDTVIRPGAVADLVRFLEHRPEAAACGPRILDLDGQFQFYSRRGFPTPLNSLAYLTGIDKLAPRSRALGGYYRRDLPPELEVQTDSLAGCFMLIRRECFEAVGGFDEDYFLFGEDIDLCWKLKGTGKEIWYVPTAVVEHRKGASMRRVRKRARHEFYYSMKLFMDKRLADRYPRFVLMLAKVGVDIVSVVERRFR